MTADTNREFADRRGDYNIESVGPFHRYPVVVNGWTVPRLECVYSTSAHNPWDGGTFVTFDHRYGLELPSDLTASVLAFIANVIAIERGWSCHPTSPEWSPPSGWWDASGAPYRQLPWERLSGVEMDEVYAEIDREQENYK